MTEELLQVNYQITATVYLSSCLVMLSLLGLHSFCSLLGIGLLKINK